MPLHHIHLLILRLLPRAKVEGLQPLDTLGFEPRAFRMRSNVIPLHHVPLSGMQRHVAIGHLQGRVGAEHYAGIRAHFFPYGKRM